MAAAVGFTASAHASSFADLNKLISQQKLATGKVTAVIGAKAVPVTPASIQSQFAQNAVFVENVRSSATTTTLPTVLAQALPAVVRAVGNPQGTLLRHEIITTATNQAAIRLQAYARDGSGLTYSATNRAFVGTVLVALAAVGSSDTDTLAQPVSLAVSAPGVRSIAPSPIVISQVGQWYSLTLVVPSPVTPYSISVSANASDQGSDIPLAIEAPSVVLSVDSTHIAGWGLAGATINITLPSADGAGALVNLASTSGTLTPSVVTLDGSGHGTALLRSTNQGTATISVLGPFVSPPVQVAFDAPWTFLLSALAGGVAGAFLRRKGRQSWLRAVAVGAVSGLVMAAAYAVGINWVGSVPGATNLASSGEAVVFVLGALGALVGVSALLGPQKRT